MVPTSTLMRASRPLLRQAAFSSPAGQALRAQRLAGQGARFRFRDSGKRWQSTADGTQQQQKSWYQRMWESEVGVKTVHFWYVTRARSTVSILIKIGKKRQGKGI